MILCRAIAVLPMMPSPAWPVVYRGNELQVSGGSGRSWCAAAEMTPRAPGPAACCTMIRRTCRF